MIGWLRDYFDGGGGKPNFGLSTVTEEQLMSDEGRAQLNRWLKQYRRTFKALDELAPNVSHSLKDLREMVPSIRFVLDSVLSDLSRVDVGSSRTKRPRRG